VCSLDPVLVNVPVVPNVKMSCVSCAYNTDCLLVGDSDGQVSVFQLRGITAPSDSQVRAHVTSSQPIVRCYIDLYLRSCVTLY